MSPIGQKKGEVMTSTEKDNRDEDKLFLQTSLSVLCRGIGSRRGRRPIRADAVCVENRKQCVARWGHLKWADVSAAEQISDRCLFRSLSYHHCGFFVSIVHLNPNLSSFCFTGIYFFYCAACCFWWLTWLGHCNWCSFSRMAGHPTTSECACVSHQLAGLISHCFHAIKL